ncbi:MAG: two-component regulator propeller domain-containing protein [Saprospiraceae bacterium]
MKKSSIFLAPLAVLMLFLSLFSCNAQEDATNQKDAQVSEATIRSSFILDRLMDINPTKEKIQLPEEDDPANQIAPYVRRIFEDHNGHLWFATNQYGAARYDSSSLRYFIKPDGLAGNQVTNFMEDKNNNLWLSTNGGVSVFDGEKFKNYTTANGLPHNWVWSIHQDKSGRIWAGTNGGLAFLSGPQFIPFELPLAKIEDSQVRFSPKLVRCIYEAKDGTLYFGTDGGGVTVYDGKDFRHITKKEGLCDDNIVCIIEDKQGNLWFGSMFGGVSKFDGKNFTNISTENFIGNNECWNIFCDSKGDVWFSSEGFGVYRYDGENLTNYSTDEGLGVKAVQTIYEDSNGILWTGGGGGLYRFDGTSFFKVVKRGKRKYSLLPMGDGC